MDNTLLYILLIIGFIYVMKMQKETLVNMRRKRRTRIVPADKIEQFFTKYKGEIDYIKAAITQNIDRQFVMGEFSNDKEYIINVTNALRKLTPHQKYVAAQMFLSYIRVYIDFTMTPELFLSFISAPLIFLKNLRDNRSDDGYYLDIPFEVSEMIKVWWSQ